MKFCRVASHFLTKILFAAHLLFLASGQAQHASAEGRRVLSLNVFAGQDVQSVKRQIEEVRALDADVIALQEVYDDRLKTQYSEAFSEYTLLDSGVISQENNIGRSAARALQSAFDLAHSRLGWAPWAPSSRAVLEGDPHGLVFLIRKSAVQVHLSTKVLKTFEVRAAPDLSTTWLETVKPKAFLMVEVTIDGIRTRLVNTHLSNGVKNPLRIRQLKEIAEALQLHDNQNQQGPLPVIFCGDTNADGFEPEMQWWHTEAGFIDTFHLKNSHKICVQGDCPTWDNKNILTKGLLKEVDQRIDFVSVRNGHPSFGTLIVKDSRIVLDEEPVSDHYGVMTEIEMIAGCNRFLLK